MYIKTRTEREKLGSTCQNSRGELWALMSVRQLNEGLLVAQIVAIDMLYFVQCGITVNVHLVNNCACAECAEFHKVNTKLEKRSAWFVLYLLKVEATTTWCGGHCRANWNAAADCQFISTLTTNLPHVVAETILCILYIHTYARAYYIPMCMCAYYEYKQRAATAAHSQARQTNRWGNPQKQKKKKRVILFQLSARTTRGESVQASDRATERESSWPHEQRVRVSVVSGWQHKRQAERAREREWERAEKSKAKRVNKR